MKQLISLMQAVALLKTGGIIAYPTESVFGLGCDPDNEQAVQAILTIKQRPIEKGLILIADNYQQLLPYIDDNQLTQAQKALAFATWPGPFTWLMPKKSSTPYFLTGQFDTIAVRVSAHPLVKQLCQAYGKAIVSTSANRSGQPATKTAEEVYAQLSSHIAIIDGPVGNSLKPSEIRDIFTGELIRAG